MRSRKLFSKVIAGMLSMVLMVSAIPVQVFATRSVDEQMTEAATDLTETQSIIYNTATVYNYSDGFYVGGTKKDVNLIDGLGDYNQDTFDLAYTQYPDEDCWEGLYFSNGGNLEYTHNLEDVVADGESVEISENFAIGVTSSGSGEIKDGADGLKDDDYATKAWTTWTQGGNSGGHIQFDATNKYYIEQIKIYFLNQERTNTPDDTYSTYPATISVHNGSQSTDAVYIENLNLNEDEEAADTYVATITLDNPIITNAVSLSFTYEFGHFVVLTEVEVFGKTVESQSATKYYAPYNSWSGHNALGTGTKRAYIYSGLAKDTLVNGQIQFNVPQAGIFDASNKSNKEVYQNIGIPFIYDSSTGYYTFDSGPNGYGIHFDDLNNDNVISNQDANGDGIIANVDTNKDGTIANVDTDNDGVIDVYEVEVEKADGMRLVLDKPFTANDNVYTSNPSVVGFFPFNAYRGADAAAATDAVYHFGMSTSIDFAMTKDGTVDGDGGDAITFEFAGDDDVWVFIDGQLVLDLGGIHDSVSAKIDFKANKVSMWSTNATYGSGDLNKANIGSTDPGYVTDLGQILNDGTNVGAIAKSYEKFAEEGEHTLTIYYLERGRGASNCLIKYNLPKQDSLEVAKSIQLAKDEEVNISAEEWSALNQVEFTFRVLDSEGNPVTGSYSLFNSATFEGTYKTDADGYFKIKNNQKARFVGKLDSDYTIEEVATNIELPAAIWKNAEWSGSVATATMKTLDVVTTANTDAADKDVLRYVVSGYTPRDKETDALFVLCTNYISRPFVSVASETVVVDYGLPVKIDIMANDVQSDGKQFIINNLSTPKSGTVKVLDTNNNVVDKSVYTATAGYYYLEYTPTKYLSDIETITYTYKVLDDTLDGQASYTYPTGVATVIPATTMYYEENFLNAEGTNYIKFSTATGYTGFKPEGTAITKYQEPGVVGTIDDSTYGSDAAYLNGTSDSNGTSYKTDTTNGPAAFQYSFTGTGTAFFARTSAKSGYLRISMINSDGTSVFTDGDGEPVTYNYIDTKYADTATEYDVELPLYNIPVFNIEGLPYDTYTVTVVVAKPSQWYADQNEFYLDGVRVYDPINLDAEAGTLDKNYDLVYDAYQKDLEEDVQVNTLRNYLLDTQVQDQDAEELVWTSDSMVMFTDTEGNVVTASEYKSNGPKQEVYMTTDQSIRFVLSNWYSDKPNDAKLYLGAKVPEGKTATVKVNGVSYTINNTTDCYYDITSAITTITNSYNGLCVIEVVTGLVSFTNLKCTGFPEFSLAGMDEFVDGSEGGDVTVYSLLRRTVEEPEAPEVEEPETPEVEEPETPEVEEPETPEVEEPDNPTKDEIINEVQETIATIVQKVVNSLKSIWNRWF